MAVINNEQDAAAAFSKQSEIFDAIYSPNLIIQYKRERVRAHVETFLQPGSNILEINAGTGEDAVYFASKGHSVHATDVATGMQNKLREKVATNNLTDKITTEVCSFTHLQQLKNKGPFDMIFSNFAGLNCTNELYDVLRSTHDLLTKNGFITIVILPPFCLWETLQALRGQFRLAFRRFNARNCVTAHIDGQYFKCWYYKPGDVINAVKDKFEVIGLEGLCTIVPPSYFEHFAEKHPKTFHMLADAEGKLKSKWPWRNIGDYYILTLRKK